MTTRRRSSHRSGSLVALRSLGGAPGGTAAVSILSALRRRAADTRLKCAEAAVCVSVSTFCWSAATVSSALDARWRHLRSADFRATSYPPVGSVFCLFSGVREGVSRTGCACGAYGCNQRQPRLQCIAIESSGISFASPLVASPTQMHFRRRWQAGAARPRVHAGPMPGLSTLLAYSPLSLQHYNSFAHIQRQKHARGLRRARSGAGAASRRDGGRSALLPVITGRSSHRRYRLNPAAISARRAGASAVAASTSWTAKLHPGQLQTTTAASKKKLICNLFHLSQEHPTADGRTQRPLRPDDVRRRGAGLHSRARSFLLCLVPGAPIGCQARSSCCGIFVDESARQRRPSSGTATLRRREGSSGSSETREVGLWPATVGHASSSHRQLRLDPERLGGVRHLGSRWRKRLRCSIAVWPLRACWSPAPVGLAVTPASHTRQPRGVERLAS